MTVSLYQTGVSGLLSAQQQLGTTGHNITNVNTEGYNRQRAEQNASLGQINGGNYIGTGTYIQDITRIYDQFSYKEQLHTHSNLGGADSLHANLNQLNEIMSSSGTAINNSIELFYQGMNAIADNPSDSGLRDMALHQANILTTDFQSLNQNFDDMEKSINGEISQMSNKISNISLEIAKINETILHSNNLSQSGQANDLLDKRDQLITQLSEYTNVSTVEDKNGIMTVMIGQGTTLVAGITPLTMESIAGDPDPLKTQLRLIGPNSAVAIDGSKLGGALAANIEFRDEHLMQVRSDVDRLAMAISSTLNDTQAQGLDLNGLQGANIFTDINTVQLQEGRVLTPSTNAGSTAAQITINDVSLLPTDEFEVRFDGTDFTLYNLTNGSSENLGAPGSGTPPGTHTPTSPDYGFSFVETGVPVAGDTFTVIPTNNSAALMRTTMLEGSAIAASSAVAVTPATSNVSDGKIDIVNVIDPVAAQAFTTPPTNTGILVDVYESAPGTFSYRVYDADPTTPPPTPPSVIGAITSGTFAAGSSVVVGLPVGTPAFEIEISGQPVGQGPLAPEKFTINDAFGVGNSTNAVALAKTQEIGVTGGGTETFNQSLSKATSVVGSKASSAELVADTSQALYTQAFNRNQATSGVNLDEEAANLLKFQQAYQAASQIISTANTIFDTILSAVR